MALKISVIIPVYNASEFVVEAVESALSQIETAEVILIEDGSPDGSLAVCLELAERFEKVRLLRHPDGINLGAAASRNLGLKNARNEYVAFLDADDYFLPGRFTVPKRLFENKSDCDGVYEALGIKFENEEARSNWFHSNMKSVYTTTMTKVVDPEELFETLIKGGAGYFSMDGLVIKHTLLSATGHMNESLQMYEDTDFILKLAASGRLLPGRLQEPVAIRRVHNENRISKPRSSDRVYNDRMKMWMSTYHWCMRKGYQEKVDLIFYTMAKYCEKSMPVMKNRDTLIAKKVRLVLWACRYPYLFKKQNYWARLLGSKIVGRMFGMNKT